MYAFVDETGNTGGNLFDEDQPDFYTAGLLTRKNFDAVYGESWRTLLSAKGHEELHANRVGLGPIEDLAPSIQDLLRKAGARFHLSRVEKKYLLATKVFDTFFDSGENAAVAWMHYNTKHLKLPLVFKVASLLDEPLARAFWDMLLARRENDARRRIPDFCSTLLGRVNTLPDKRSQEVIGGALEWARDHPEAFDFALSRKEAQKGHMPNLVAFTSLIEGIEAASVRWKRPVVQITHDRQDQFQKALASHHEMFSNAAPDVIEMPDDKYSLRKVPGSIFVISKASDSPGLQIADLMLWLMKQHFAKKELPPKSARLTRYITARSHWHDFSFAGVETSLVASFDKMPALEEMSPEQLKQGQELRRLDEERRQESMRQYEIDTMSPHARNQPK